MNVDIIKDNRFNTYEVFNTTTEKLLFVANTEEELKQLIKERNLKIN
jgi:hypothetical protein